MGFRADLVQRAFTANLLVVGINIIVSLWIAYGHHNLARLRRLTYLAMITDAVCIIYLAWLVGSVTSQRGLRDGHRGHVSALFRPPNRAHMSRRTTGAALCSRWVRLMTD